MGGVYSLIGSIGMMAFIALGFSAMTKTIVAITPRLRPSTVSSEQTDYQKAYQAECLAQEAKGVTATVLSL